MTTKDILKMVALINYLPGNSGTAQFIILLGIADLAAAITAIVRERHTPSAALAWVMVIFMLPVAGVILYFLLSQNAARKKMFRLSSYEEQEIDESLSRQITDIEKGSFDFSTDAGDFWKDMIHLNQLYGRAYYTQDNRIDFLTDGRDMFDALIRDIRNAEHTVNIMFFIIKYDEIGRKLIEELTQKALEGVEVRLFMDSMGSRHINDKMLADLLQAGGRRSYFFPKRLKLVNIKFNYRNHRKLAVIDGEIGYIGGFNIAREYLGRKKKFGYWRDTHIRITGQAVQDINARFLMDWRFSSGEDLTLSEAYYSPVIKRGVTGIQIVSSGPDSLREEVKRAYMKMITSSSRSVYIQTPYFVPDPSILESLKMAAQCGVDVRLMIPCKPDHPFVYWATYAYAGELIRSGGHVYIYDNGFLHAKTIVVDGEVGSVGSTNFDRRSFALNFESNAFIYDRQEAEKMERIFRKDMESCHELTRELYDDRGISVKVREVAARLLSDLL